MKSKPYNLSGDAALTSITSRMDEIPFEDLEAAPEWPLKGVTLFPDLRTYRVRCSIGGRLCTLGIGRSAASAARLSDAARLRFWVYRRRDVRPPTDLDLNFSLGRAQKDLETNEELVELFKFVEGHLREIGVIRDVSNEGTTSNERRTLRHEIANTTATLESQMLAMLAEIKREYGELQRGFQHLITRLDSLDAAARKASEERGELRVLLARFTGRMEVLEANSHPPVDILGILKDKGVA